MTNAERKQKIAEAKKALAKTSSPYAKRDLQKYIARLKKEQRRMA